MMRAVDVDRSTGIEYDEFFSIMAPKIVQHRLKSGGVETVAGRLDVQGVYVCVSSLSRFLPFSLSFLSLSLSGVCQVVCGRRRACMCACASRESDERKRVIERRERQTDRQSLCVCVCVYTAVCLFVSASVSLCLSVSLSIHTHTHTHTHTPHTHSPTAASSVRVLLYLTHTPHTHTKTQ